jgi:two-component system cell cycle response regulator
VLEGCGAVVAEAGWRGQLLATAHRHGADVLLLHRDLGDALPEVKRDPDLFRIAVVLVGEPPDVEAAVDALEHGAHDVLRDGAAPGEVVARVRAARRAQEMQEQLLSRERDLERMAYRDELTGTANRRFAMRQLHALLSRARRHEHALSVVLLDVDGFKALNDRHGHAAGDEVLRGIAGRFSERVRTEDVVARFGGEEFLVILPDTGATGAATAAEDLRAAVAAATFPAGRIALRATVSAGWATWEGESLDRLVARADAGLYAAKEAGRDRVRPGPAAGATRH